MTNHNKQPVIQKKLLKRKYIIAVGLILLLITPVLVFIQLSQNQKPDPASEKVIREVAAKQLNKYPNELTDEDFEKITSLIINNTILTTPISFTAPLRRIELADIELLEKFTNLKSLRLGDISYPKKSIPRWMFIMAKLGIINPEERFALDLSPIRKLNNIERLAIHDTSIKDIKPLAGLTNLKRLSIYSTQVNDFAPLKNLRNLNILKLEGTSASDLTSVKNLTNLKSLYVSVSDINNLEPLKELTNLRILNIMNCPNITDEQVEDLQNALPNLEIKR